MSKYALVVGFAIATLSGCGDSKSDQSASKDPANKTAPVAEEIPAINCDQFMEKMVACVDDFEKVYSTTSRAKKVGSGDGAAGAKTFVGMFRHEHNRELGKKICSDTLNGDNRYKKAVNACDFKAECGVWAECAGKGIGEI